MEEGRVIKLLLQPGTDVRGEKKTCYVHTGNCSGTCRYDMGKFHKMSSGLKNNAQLPCCLLVAGALLVLLLTVKMETECFSETFN
jgi:hypothetical protein